MGSLTTVAKNEILDALDGLFLALFVTSTDDDGSGTELAGGGYDRQPIALDPAVDGLTHNSSSITFDSLPASGAIVDCAIFTLETGGTMKLHQPLSTPIDLIEGAQIVFAPGDLVIAAD